MTRKLTLIPILLLAGTLTLNACKRKAAPEVSVSPRTTQAVAASGEPEQSPEQESQAAISALGPIEEPDAKVKAAPAPPAAADDTAAKEAAAARAMAATQQAVTAALRQRMPQLKACYQRTSTGTSALKVKLRVHRQGYILDTTISGANSAADSCMKGVLSNMQVSGVQTDSLTVERTLNFSATRVIRQVKTHRFGM